MFKQHLMFKQSPGSSCYSCTSNPCCFQMQNNIYCLDTTSRFNDSYHADSFKNSIAILASSRCVRANILDGMVQVVGPLKRMHQRALFCLTAATRRMTFSARRKLLFSLMFSAFVLLALTAIMSDHSFTLPVPLLCYYRIQSSLAAAEYFTGFVISLLLLACFTPFTFMPDLIHKQRLFSPSRLLTQLKSLLSQGLPSVIGTITIKPNTYLLKFAAQTPISTPSAS